MAGRDDGKAVPSGSVDRTKDVQSKAADEDKTSRQGNSAGPTDKSKKPVQVGVLDMFKVQKHKSGNVYLPPDLWKK